MARLDHATFKLHGELPGCPHHVPDDDYEEKVTSSVEKARTGMRTKDPRLAQHCTRTWALPSPRGRPRRRICSCPSSAESGVSTQEMAPSGGSPRAEAPSPSSQQCATPRFLACNTASWTRYSLGNSQRLPPAPMGTRVRRSRHPASRSPSSPPTTPSRRCSPTWPPPTSPWILSFSVKKSNSGPPVSSYAALQYE